MFAVENRQRLARCCASERCYCRLRKIYQSCSIGLYVCSFLVGSGLLLSAQLVTINPHDKDGKELSHRQLIRNASSLAVESVSTLFHQTALAYMDAEEEYTQAIADLVSCLEYMLMYGNRKDASLSQDEVWEKIIAARHLVNEKKRQKVEAERIFESAEKLLSCAAEIAFASGADQSAVWANERLLSVKTRMSLLTKLASDAETNLNETEATLIKNGADRKKLEAADE